ncbi:hypothetical protein ALP26_04236 [Pseudomonas savastanoi pv. glycinea]|uniref:Uncharacterized protein n=14 Tax=Pseudomonas syringae group TaxID=136849 RepID=A0A3M6I262_PSEAJ|nr:hypothetical protein PSPPH_2343 [Pseudomonas savastanoi pv. phaseolicola 1448A]KPB40520.1 Uncharacterized protein AC514_4747 [Pseudomonas savastanoi pv. phaseolicola]KPB60026.1 Uncharacterized protein AC510_0784 [Pseudomonas amygdali pv. myricae]KPB65881.1 Uncharacterized protein AC508_4077 [Pseudomonas amygdali pv. mellea]KPB86731.1 Uncharacterized protein AC504_3833 [Pseudomonas syringae pv. maculicola]KPC21170.1 Uncharacterized protein AC497_0418 [Pseudomonas savastanoi pv. glycinea]KPC
MHAELSSVIRLLKFKHSPSIPEPDYYQARTVTGSTFEGHW